MKLRIHNNSLRLRLSRSEVDRLAAGHPLRHDLHFAPGRTLTYQLIPSATAITPTAALDFHTITITLPLTAITQWSSTDEVGIYATLPTDTPTPLTLAIEKDFSCLHNPPANQDTFPNPNTLP